MGNTFGATALSSYGGFWIAYALLFTPSLGIIDAYPTAATATEAQLHPEHRITTLTPGSAGGAPGSAGGPQGVRVVTERVPSVRSVALGFWIATGSVA